MKVPAEYLEATRKFLENPQSIRMTYRVTSGDYVTTLPEVQLVSIPESEATAYERMRR